MLPFLRYLNICTDFFGHVGELLDKKAKIIFKTYDVKTWKTNNYNTHIAHYLKEYRYQIMKFGHLLEYNVRNIFLKKSCRKWDRETSSRPLSVLFFFLNFIWGKKQVVCTLVAIYFDSLQLGHPIKTNHIKLQTIDPELCSILIF